MNKIQNESLGCLINFTQLLLFLGMLDFVQMIEIRKVKELEEKQRELFCLDQRNSITTCSLNNKMTSWVEIIWKCFSFSMSLWNNHFYCIFLPMKWIIFMRIQMFLCKSAALPYCVLSKHTFFTELTSFACLLFGISKYMSGTSSKDWNSCSCSAKYKEQI